MDADREMQEYSESYMGRGRKIVSRIFSYAFRVIVFSIIALVLWRVLLSDRIPSKAKALLVNDATYAAYLAEGDELDMYTQYQEKLAVDERDAGIYGLFWVNKAVFIPGAEQVQILTRYNNSTLRHIATDYKLDAIPDRNSIIADVTLVVTTDPTPDAPKSGDEYKTRYAASGEPVKNKTAMYNYRSYVFDDVTIDPLTTTDVTVEFYYVDRVDYDAHPYSSLRIYDSESENEAVELTSRDKKALGAYAASTK